MAEKLERYLALVPLMRHHKIVPAGQWVRLEAETGDILGIQQAVPESALKGGDLDPAVLHVLVESRVCFEDGALVYARHVAGLSPVQCVALAHQHAAEFVKRRGNGLSLVGGIRGTDLEKWSKK